MSAPEASVPRLEIQVIPSGVSQRPRAVRLGPVAYRLSVFGLTVYGLLVLTGLALVPGMVRDVASLSSHRAARLTEERLRERRTFLGGRFAALAEDAAQLRSRLRKIHLAYGLEGAGALVGLETEVVEAADAEVATAAPEAPSFDSEPVAERAMRVEVLVESLESVLSEIERYETENPGAVAVIPALSPLRQGSFVLTESLGYAKNSFTQEIEFHPGVDLAAPVGTTIHAPADGRVVFASRYPLGQSSFWWRQGNIVALASGDRFVTVFGHCDQILVRRGQTVRRGEPLATTGESGWSPNAKLHYGVWRFDEDRFKPVAPRLYMLDHRWEDDADLLANAGLQPTEGSYDPLPQALQGR